VALLGISSWIEILTELLSYNNKTCKNSNNKTCRDSVGN